MKIPKYRRHSKGGAFVEWKRVRYYLPGLHDSKESRSAYVDFINRNCRDSSRQASVPPDPMTIPLAELATRFLDWFTQQPGFNQKEFELFRRVLSLLVQREGTLRVSEFGPRRLEGFRDWLASETFQREYSKKADPEPRIITYRLARATVNHLTARLKRVVRWGVRQELVSPNHLVALQSVPGLRAGHSQALEPKKRQPVDAASVSKTIPHLTPTIAAMVQLQFLVGCRPQDVCGIRPMDVDRTSSPWCWKPSHHKNAHRGQDLTIWIGPQAQRVLGPWLDRPADRFCFSPVESVEQGRSKRNAERITPPSCGNRPGTNRKPAPSRKPGDRYSTAAYGKAVGAACKKAGIDRWTPHQLRHARATEVRRLYGLEAAQAVLGHSSIDATQIYAHRLSGEARRVAMETG